MMVQLKAEHGTGRNIAHLLKQSGGSDACTHHENV